MQNKIRSIINTLVNKVKSIFPQSTDTALVRHMKTRRLVRAGGYTMLASMAIYALCFVFPPVHDDASYAVTGTPLASDTTLSISVDNDVLSLDLTPLSTNGTFATTTTPATIYVTTNNITGYTLGIRTTTSTDTATKLINNIDECIDTPTSTKCSLSTIDTAVSEQDYEATTSTDLNNTWGYLPSKYNSLDNTDYLPAPSTGELDILDITDAPSEIDTTNNTNELIPTEYTIDLGSRIDYTPYAGQYSGTLIVTAVGNPVPYSVSYNANKPALAPAEATVSNLPTAQTGTVSSGDTIAVLLSQKVPTLGTQDTNNNPSTGQYNYAGYVFNGWCNTEPTEDPTTGYQTCPVEQEHITLYQPGDTYGIDQTTDNTETLYAVWGAPATVTFNSNGLVYNATATDIDNVVEYIPTYTGGTTAGQRENQIYTGTYLEPAPLNPSDHYIFKGWSTEQTSTEPTYTTEQDIINNLNLNANDNITLYAIWAYATVITFDKNGADGTETMEPQYIEAGTTANLTQNAYTNTGYVFASWNTEATPTEQTPGTSYPDQAEYQAEASQSADVTLHAQWIDCAPNSICYNDNGADSPTTMSDQSASSNTDVELWASNYKYDTNNDGHNDYGFAGWSKDKDAATKLVDNDPANNPVVYGPNQTITTGDLSLEGMKLYAVWIAPEENTTFQTFTCPSDTDMSIGSLIALKDSRDNEVYTVAKLADGNCWMTENLRLDNNATINATNTDSPISSFTALSRSSSSWCTQNTEACFNRSMLNTNNIASAVSEMTGTNANIYSYSNYYNWYSATAGNGTRSVSSGTVAGDICPAGWHLPYGGNQTSEKGGDTSGGFYYLNNLIGGDSNAWRSFPNNFVYSGIWYDSSARNRGNFGYYWSSTAYGTYGAYVLYFGSGGVDPGTNSNGKGNGFSVRCVAPVE